MVDIKKLEHGDIDILVVVGEVDASSSIQLDSAINAEVSGGTKKLLIDCTALDYISSAGLGVFMSYIEEVKIQGASMAICGLNEKVQNVFQILGLDQLLNIYPDREKGIESFE